MTKTCASTERLRLRKSCTDRGSSRIGTTPCTSRRSTRMHRSLLNVLLFNATRNTQARAIERCIPHHLGFSIQVRGRNTVHVGLQTIPNEMRNVVAIITRECDRECFVKVQYTMINEQCRIDWTARCTARALWIESSGLHTPYCSLYSCHLIYVTATSTLSLTYPSCSIPSRCRIRHTSPRC